MTADVSPGASELPHLSDRELDLVHTVFDLARDGSTDGIEEFLEAGVPVNLTNSAGDSLLMLAAYHQHLESVEMLLARGADVERVNDRGQTALGAAVFRQRSDIATALMDHGADPDEGTPSARSIADFFGLDQMQELFARSSRSRSGTRSAPDDRR